MAKAMSDEQRRQALELAEMWERLARDRERQHVERKAEAEAA